MQNVLLEFIIRIYKQRQSYLIYVKWYQLYGLQIKFVFVRYRMIFLQRFIWQSQNRACLRRSTVLADLEVHVGIKPVKVTFTQNVS